MKASDFVVRFLRARGVPCVFELSGGMITHLLDSFQRDGRVRVVSVHHEQAAAFAAEGVGRITGIPGVALATSGPGATNLLTGIGSCYFDSTPAVFITGQVNRHELRGDRAIRQLGFQETDIVSVARPITKAAWMVREAGDLPRLLREAFELASSGRPGPVLLDLPMDVQRAEIPDEALNSTTHEAGAGDSEVAPPPSAFEFLGELRAAERPLILAGGGVRSARAVDQFRRFAAAADIPVVHSLMGVDVLPHDHPLRVGLIGTYGNRWANLAVGRSDLLIVLGSRLDVRQTGSQTEAFKAGRRIVHVDCEPGEINNRVTGCHGITAELGSWLPGAMGRLRGAVLAPRDAWKRELADLRAAWPDEAELAGTPGINPNAFMHALSRSQSAAAAMAYVVDVGQHQMWAAQSLELRGDQRFLTSGGMGSMGFALPTAVGVASVSGGRPVVMVAGDGGFQCNIQELQTVARNQMPIKMAVMNNRCHGMVRQFQASYFEGRYPSTVWGYSAPDFARVSEAYGIPARRVASWDEVAGALDWLWNEPGRPSLLEVSIDSGANAFPKIAFGHPITEMEPRRGDSP